MKFVKNCLWLTPLLAALLCGCSKQAPQTTVDPKAFDTAAPEVKQMWDQATAAASQNDFASAIKNLRLLSRRQISPEQGQAIHDTMVAYEAKLTEAAKRGDATARKDMQTLGLGSVPSQ